MTMREFLHSLRALARQHQRPVIAVDFEPAPDGKGLALKFRFRDEQS